MSNNRDDKFESDDSEYHFSDEEVNYEVESETPKTTQPTAGGGNQGPRLTNARRMLISFGIFLSIVFVVYKFVSPGSTTPSTDLTVASTETTAQPAAAQPQVAAAPAQPAVQAQAQPQSQPQSAQAPVVPQPPQMAVPAQPVAAGMPAVIPVQSAVPAGGQSPAAAMSAYIEDKSAVMSAASQQAMAQMQAQYNQQYNEFNSQTKNMQNQIQTLSTRVADMEAQINQLVQVLTRRSHAAAAPGSSMNAPVSSPVQPARPEVRVAYNVQAIIPGRAWLKSENGETLTVAEGDVIRDVGRVTRIDPYDGVVEINTGTKAVSLSYGSGG